MSRPRLLDLFCGVGGASAGYVAAGFEVVGVDIAPQPRYPFAFVQANAMTYPLDGFDVIHASPPCQAYSWSGRQWDMQRSDLLEPVRDRLVAAGVPYVIENVIGAPLREPVMLCGTMFGLELIKHRLFETREIIWPSPGHPSCWGAIIRGAAVTVAGHGGESRDTRASTWQRAIGIDWTRDRHELAEAIPPAYTEWLGGRLMEVIR